MSYFTLSPLPPEEATSVREAWLNRLTQLVDQVEAWARELGWSTRRVDRKLEDTEIGAHRAPGLLMQADFTRVALEPIGRSAPGVDGVVALYRLPAYDDIATLFHEADSGRWMIRYPLAADLGDLAYQNDVPVPLSEPLFRAVLADMIRDDA